MSFIAKHITHRDERLMYLTRLHSILLIRGFLWMGILVSLGIYINWLILYKFEMLPSASVPFIPAPYSQIIDMMAGLIPALTGIMIFLIYLFKVWGTEIALTNKRMIYKTGLLFVQSSEVELAEVSEASVDNGWLGVPLGYGTIHLDCRFVGDFTIQTVKHPYTLVRQINKFRSGEAPVIPL
ncbi:MAG TPA: hypothetical protein DCM27_01860 [Rhodospirillaceae bacterium]|nr:hypothetical protein [Rhodospirillaceae bacterium]